MVISTPPPVSAAVPKPMPIDDAVTPRVDDAVMPRVDDGPVAPKVDDAVAPKPDGWKLYDETNATAAIVDAVDGAKQVVNAEFFGFTDAGKGASLVTALEGAARRGVEVNVVTDFISSLALPPGSWHRMRNKVRDAGGSVILTSRIPFSPRAKETPALKHVDHRKVVTIDGTEGFVGGMNLVPLTDSYKDSMVGLTGVAAARLAAEQLDRWGRVGGTVTERHVKSVERALDGAPARTDDPVELRIIANAPDTKRFELTDGYSELIRNAKERIWIATPGISDRDVMRDINAAAARGVDVRIIASQKAPVVPLVGWVARAHMADLVKHGGIAYEVPGTLHRKALVVDDEAILSSYNLTKRSAEHDHEVGVRTKDPAFVAAVAKLLEDDIARSSTFDPATLDGASGAIGRVIADKISY